MSDTTALKLSESVLPNDSDSKERTPRKTGIFHRKSEISQNALPRINKESSSLLTAGSIALATKSLKSRLPTRAPGIFSRERTELSLQSSTKTNTPQKLNRKRSKTSLDIEFACKHEKNSRASTPAQKWSNTSHLVATSALSLNISTNSMHKPGTIPAYLRKPNKFSVESELAIKNRKFNLQKKKLSELQTACMDQYKNIISLHQKLSGNGFKMETLELLAYAPTDTVDNSSGCNIICSSKNESEKMASPKNNLLFLISDRGVLEFMEKQMREMNVTNFKLCQKFMDSNYNFTKELKELNVDDLANFSTCVEESYAKMEETILKTEKDQNETIKESIKKLENMLFNAEGVLTAITKDTLISELNSIIDQHIIDKEKSQNSLEEFKLKIQAVEQQKKTLEKNKIDYESNKEKGLKKEISDKEKEIEKLNCKCKSMSASIKKLERELDEFKIARKQQLNEVSNTENEMSYELEKSKMRIQDYLKQITDLKNNMADMQKSGQEQIYDLTSELSKEHEERLQLMTELRHAKESIEQYQQISINEMQILNAALGAGGECGNVISTHHLPDELEQLRKELELHKNTIQKLTNENDMLLKDQQDFNQKLETYECSTNREISVKSSEIHLLEDRCHQLQLQLDKREKSIQHKNNVIEKLEKLIHSETQKMTNLSNDMQLEIQRLLEAECRNKEEIEHMQNKLSKAVIQLKQQDETICMHQRILRIRSELINSMQLKDGACKCQMAQLFSEIEKKSSTVSKMDFEISARSEELQNLFSTLTTKQMEITRQDQIIQMLEENNARNQRIRARQFERIELLEQENAELRQQLNGKVTLDSPDIPSTMFNRKMFEHSRKHKRKTQVNQHLSNEN